MFIRDRNKGFAMDGVKLSLMGKSQEEIDEILGGFLNKVGENFSAHIQSQLGLSLEYTIDDLTNLAVSLTSVNEVFGMMNLSALEMSIKGAELAKNLTLSLIHISEPT